MTLWRLSEAVYGSPGSGEIVREVQAFLVALIDRIEQRVQG
jgi:hypothetical protein